MCCVGDDPTSDANGGDASADGNANGDGSTSGDGGTSGDAIAPPASGFVLSLTPAHVTTDPGDKDVQVTIVVTRATSFTDDVGFTVSSSDSDITATTPIDTGNGGTSSTFTISVGDAGALTENATVTINGANPTKSFSANAKLSVRVGSLLETSDGGILVPSYATGLVVKVWGAGGGAGAADNSATTAGGPGGGGGFATGTIPVTGGELFELIVGTAGQPATPLGSNVCGGGGGGGGYSAVFNAADSSNYLLVAGGGGGGGSAANVGAGGAGGAGGGMSGEQIVTMAPPACGGGGGTQTQGGLGGVCDGDPNAGNDGGAYQGGTGYSPGFASTSIGAGLPGGGLGGGTDGADHGCGGGGGGGYFGGGGGAGPITSVGGGGGGGSGYAASVVTGAVLMTGSGTMPANRTDPDFVAGTGIGGNPLAGAGRVVVRLTKP